MLSVSAKGMLIGEDSPSAKYTDYEVDCVMACREAGMTYGQIAKHMDMPRSTVYAICTGKIRATMVDRWR